MVSSFNYKNELTPPGSIRISDNKFYDIAEVTNLDWREYMYWTAQTFGTDSQEYFNSFPDTTVWLELDSCYQDLASTYLKSQEYNSFPVVGISQAQAQAYSQWRSDRVFQKILVDLKILDPNPGDSSGNYFTTEKYLKGEYHGLNPDQRIKYFPRYHLPSWREYSRALAYQDSLFKEYGSCENPQEGISRKGCRTAGSALSIRPTWYECPFGKLPHFCFLNGNLSEWSAHEGTVFGQSWRDDKDMDKPLTGEVPGPNAWTGFRNACQWVGIEGTRSIEF